MKNLSSTKDFMQVLEVSNVTVYESKPNGYSDNSNS